MLLAANELGESTVVSVTEIAQSVVRTYDLLQRPINFVGSKLVEGQETTWMSLQYSWTMQSGSKWSCAQRYSS